MTSVNGSKNVRPLRKFNDQEAMIEIVQQGKDFSAVQIIGMMIARMHEHYNEEHKKFIAKLHGLRNDPIYLTRVIENQLKRKFNPETGEFDSITKSQLEL